jgi:hypothetical protein
MNLRDYLFIEDMVSGVMALSSYGGPFRIFNFQAGRVILSSTLFQSCETNCLNYPKLDICRSVALMLP